MAIVDAQRFGVFHYEAFSEVGDFRVERYLPPEAEDITISKNAMGHRAKYSISESEMMQFLDDLSKRKSGDQSAVTRNELNQAARVTSEDIKDKFGDLGWPAMANPIKLHSSGGGATYYFDPHSSTTYHIAGYW